MVTFYKIALLTVLSISWPSYSHAATTFFSPQSVTSSVGKTFILSIQVASPQEAMNAASGTISFPKDKLEVVSISKTGSIFSLWVQEPTFSNTSGTVTFEGIVLNPGFTGSSAKILTITFRAKQEGGANVKFSSGSILANDGSGINILSNPGAATINITSRQVQPTELVVPQIKKDTIPPEPFQITFLDGTKTTNTQPQISFGTIDKESGVSYYTIQIDQLKEEVLQSSLPSNRYSLAEQTVGDHVLTVKAFDKAGNTQVSVATFTIAGVEQVNLNNTPISASRDSFKDILYSISEKVNRFILNNHILIIIVLIVLQLIALVRLVFLAKRNKSHISESEIMLKGSLDALHQDIQQHLNRLTIAQQTRALSQEETLFLEHFAKGNLSQAEASMSSHSSKN